MKTLTVFTPTYNRAHTLGRVFESLLSQTNCDFEWLIIDDGSSDGTRKLVESWGDMMNCDVYDVDWMGRTCGYGERVVPKVNVVKRHFVIEVSFKNACEKLRITYLYKENGGLYTGYNAAYANINTELCVYR